MNPLEAPVSPSEVFITTTANPSTAITSKEARESAKSKIEKSTTKTVPRTTRRKAQSIIKVRIATTNSATTKNKRGTTKMFQSPLANRGKKNSKPKGIRRPHKKRRLRSKKSS